jgi:hypothetical protein
MSTLCFFQTPMADEPLPLQCPKCGKPLRAELIPDGYVDVCSEHGRLSTATEPPPVIAQLDEIERAIEDIRRELDAQMKRIAQIQGQVNGLHAKSRRP